MLRSDAELTQGLSEAVAGLVPEAFGQGAQLETLSPLRMDRRYSFMFRYWVRKPDQSRCSLLVKIPHQDWIHSIAEAVASDRVREEIKHEFATMQSVYRIVQNSKHPQLFAINPVGGYLPEYNAIIMEEVPLEMLKEQLSAFSIIVNDQTAWMNFEKKAKLAGEWLRLIHDAFRQDQTRRLAELDLQKTALSEMDALEKLSGRRLTKVRASFMQLYELLHDWPVPISALHNDFHLGNIFVTPDGRVGALDPNWKDAGAVYEDLASLLIDPITRKLQVLLRGLAFRSAQRMRFEQAVLGGYFEKEAPPYPILYLYCAVDLLAKWRKNEEILRSKPWVVASPGSRYIGSYFQRLVASYLALGIDRAVQQSTPG